jgi:acetylornithine deacetylase/succinyl-diaminopimelate desuccinylase-like protein
MQTNKIAADIDKYIHSIRQEYETNLKTFVDIPSVSADPAHKPEIHKMAEAAISLLKKFGAKAEIIQTDGNPVVYGLFEHSANAPTLTIYNHLDVQPADANEWQNPPFSLTIEGDLYKGRGSTDDKGPALAALYASKYAHDQGIPLNIKFIWELEEEIGSPNFLSVLVSDTIWISKDKPAIAYGLRGLLCVLVRLNTGKKDVHSGTTGGVARNPIGELSQLISECYDAKSGEVKIPGFYDDVLSLADKELENMKNSGFSLDYFKKAHELISVRVKDPIEAIKRICVKPTFEVHGIVGGYSGPGVKTIVPHAAEAKISMRLVPSQSTDKIFKLFSDFVKSKCPDAEIIRDGSLEPFMGRYDDKYNQAAAAAMKNTFNCEPIFTREGGSIGAVVSMDKVLKAPIVFLGLSLPEHGYHAINENFDWPQASGGIKLFVDYFQKISRI